MRKLLFVVLCGFIQRFECTRVKFEPGYHEPVYRHDSHFHSEPLYKREHFYPRESIPAIEQMLPPQPIMRNDPIYANEPIMASPPQQQGVIANDDYVSNNPLLQNEPFIRREPFLRREPLFRREPFIRGEPLIRSGRVYPSGGIFRSEPNAYTFMVSQCPCQESQGVGQPGPQDTFFQIPQPIQAMTQQPIVAHRLIFPKPVLKPQGYQPIVTFPRIQRFLRKNFKPIPDNIQFSAPPVQNSPVQEFNSFGNEPVSFPGNFQNQGQQQETTSESAQNNPVTVRNVPQMPNPLTLAQMSSIC